MIIVTGGAGFLGSNLLAGLEAHGARDLVACDRLGRDGKWRNIAGRELADLIAPEVLFDFLDRHETEIEAIFHLGAISATTERDADLLVQENIRPTLDLWDWCARHGRRLIYASSAATYGDGAEGFDDDSSPAALARLKPLNGYAWSKHLVDRRVARLVARGGPRPQQWAGLKFFNVYGPNEYHKGPMRSVAQQLFEQISEGGRARLFRSHRPDFADGGQLRDFVWVEDCVAVMLWLLENPHVGGLYNVGSGKARSFADLARAMFAALGRPEAIDFVDTPAEIRDKYQYFTEARIERLRAAGYARPFTGLEDGVGRYVRDFLASGTPYR